MKTLALRQPWATYVAEGTKPIEVRTWRTAYRGPLLIVASGKPQQLAAEDGQIWSMPTQIQVCIVDLIDVRPMQPDDEPLAHCPWAPNLYAWRVENPRHVKPVAHRGRLNLYHTDPASIAQLPDEDHYLDHLA